VRALGVSFSGARKKGEKRIMGCSLEYTIQLVIELGGYYSDLAK
jgi:hypothetical protein